MFVSFLMSQLCPFIAIINLVQIFMHYPLIPSSATAVPFLSFAMLFSSSLRVMSLSSTSVRIWMLSVDDLDTLYAFFLCVSCLYFPGLRSCNDFRKFVFRLDFRHSQHQTKRCYCFSVFTLFPRNWMPRLQ